MKFVFFEIVHAVAILAYGVFSASFVLSGKASDFESIVAIGLFLIVSRLEFNRD